MQVVRNIQVQLGGRSLDVPISSLPRLPSLGQLRHHTGTLFGVPPQQTPVFVHNGARVADEQRWAGILSGPGAPATLRLRAEFPTPGISERHAAPPQDGDPGARAPPGGAGAPPEARAEYFAVQGKNGNTTLYLEKSDFDRRMTEFAREGSLGPGMRVIFPPAYKDEYTRLFRERGAGVVVTTQATALLKRWHQSVAISSGIVVGGLAAGGLGMIAAEVAEGAAVTVATEATASTVAAEATASSGSATFGMGAGAIAAAVALGYLTYRGLKWLLPEVHKEQYTILMSVPDEDAGMLEIGRQMSIVESSTGPLCGICMERPQDAAAVPCGHTACHTCLEQLIRRHNVLSATPCPHCREPIRSIQRIYL